MKAILHFAMLFLCGAAVAAAAGRNGPAQQAAESPAPNLEREMEYERTMANHVHDEIKLYGSNARIRGQIKEVDGLIFHAIDALKKRNYDPAKMEAEIARIDDLLHSIDYELRDAIAHEPATLTGGRTGVPR